MMFDEQTAVQMKMLRMIMLCDNLCTREGYGHNLSPSEALAYKQLLDFVRQHARILEMHLRDSIEEHEQEREEHEQEQQDSDRQRNQPQRRVAKRPYRPPDSGFGESEEGDGLGPPVPG